MAQTPLTSQLLQTLDEAPVMIAVSPEAPAERCLDLAAAGCEVWQGTQRDANQRLLELINDLGRRPLMNVLVEGGAAVLGALCDLDQLDEAHVFVSPKLIGGLAATCPVGGEGAADMSAIWQLDDPEIENLDGDVYIHGPVQR